jgi:hypothetical protein
MQLRIIICRKERRMRLTRTPVLRETVSAEILANALRCKLTDWAEGKPPAVGVWNASTIENPQNFRLWDGAQWLKSQPDPQSAARETHPAPNSAQQAIKWRGLDRNPVTLSLPPDHPDWRAGTNA